MFDQPTNILCEATGEQVVCYGILADNSNFSIVCMEEEDDCTWCDGNPNTDDSSAFSSWDEVVNILQQYINSPIVEIQAV